jgi:hypothetical protein
MPSAVDRLRLPTGGYVLSVLYEADRGTCAGDTPSFALATRIRLTREAQGWVARSASATDGSVEFTFHDVAGEPAGAVYINVAGVVQGVANDVNNPVLGLFRRSVRFGAGDGERIEMRGRALNEGPILIGEVGGSIRVEGVSSGGVASCTSAQWSITPP